ncbi:hypothetical protein NYA30BAC_01325 [Halomonas sp. NYA30]
MINASWASQRGRECPNNRDIGGYYVGANFVFALIVDISQRGPRGVDFAYDWTSHVLEGVSRHDTLSPQEVIATMKQACRALRHCYPAESGSYAAVIIDLQRHTAFGVSCGDCRLGVLRGEHIEWLSPVHTLAASLANAEETVPELSPSRHILTRSLKARRFTQPEVVQFEAGLHSILLATDGYWVEHLIEQVPFHQLADDASCLMLSADSSTVSSDCNNWLALS